MYPDEHAQVNAVTSNLDGDAAGWLVSLHDEGTPELQDLDAFMQMLQNIFEDPTMAWCAETCICSQWQGKQLLAEYI